MENNVYLLTVSFILFLACLLQVAVPLLFAVTMRNRACKYRQMRLLWMKLMRFSDILALVSIGGVCRNRASKRLAWGPTALVSVVKAAEDALPHFIHVDERSFSPCRNKLEAGRSTFIVAQAAPFVLLCCQQLAIYTQPIGI